MRVLHVIPSVAADHGGPSHALASMQRALAGRQLRVDVAATDDDGKGGHAGEQARVQDSGEVRLFHRTTLTYKVSVRLASWLWRNVASYDVVHVHALFSFSSVAAALAARWRGVPYVLRPLGTLSSYGMSRRRPWLKRLSYLVVERPMLRRAAAVHFTSDQERIEAELLGSSMRSAVIPLAIEAPRPADAQRLSSRFPLLGEGPKVLFLSRLDPKKNVEGLLHAIAGCAAAVPDARWLIAGQGDPAYVASLHGLAAKLGIAERIAWAGHLEGADKDAAWALADLFVLPSLSENFGIAAAEAMLAGLPVVLAKGVALSELAESAGAGIRVEPTPESIGAAMQRLLLDPDLRAECARRGRLLGEAEFSTSMMADRLLSLYREVSA